MASRVWDQYAARDLHDRASDPTLAEVMKGGGRGYYRPISLLSLWAFAPFMHNDAIGPELCGNPADRALDLYFRLTSIIRHVARQSAACWPFDPSIEARWQRYKTSMDELLHPDRRIPKMFLTGDDIVIDVAPRIKIGNIDTGLSLRIPKGTPAVMLNSLRYKDLIQDLSLVDRDPAALAAKYRDLLSDDRFRDLQDNLRRLRARLFAASRVLQLGHDKLQVDFIQAYYSNVLEHVVNGGHRFGEDLSEREKQALIAFLATF